MEKHTNEVEDNQMRALSWKTRVSYGLGDTSIYVMIMAVIMMMASAAVIVEKSRKAVK